MTMLTSITVMLAAILILIMVPRIYSNWLQFREYAEQSDLDKLIELQALHNQWIIRHLFIALLALGFVTAMKYMPELEMYSQTATAMAAYSIISFILAFAESIMAQKIAAYAAASLQPVKERRKDQRYY